jgi:uncharacterized membrane-anchored protein
VKLATVFMLLLPCPLLAQDLPDSMIADSSVSVEALDARMNYRHGSIVLKEGMATLNVPEGYRYLDPEQAEFILVKVWGNPPRDQKTLGMLFPESPSPFEREGWGVVITFDEDGYVKDDDAEKIDYADLLKEMQEGTSEASKEREKQGYETIRLVGWGEPPRYDRASHKLYWAQEIEFGGDPDHTLNYNIRVLGRRGVLVLNAVSSIGQLAAVKESTPGVLAAVEFNEGHRYADYLPGTDKAAAYGIGGLILGSAAAKAGLFKGIWLVLLASKKLVFGGLVALGALAKKFLGGNKDAAAQA